MMKSGEKNIKFPALSGKSELQAGTQRPQRQAGGNLGCQTGRSTSKPSSPSVNELNGFLKHCLISPSPFSQQIVKLEHLDWIFEPPLPPKYPVPHSFHSPASHGQCRTLYGAGRCNSACCQYLLIPQNSTDVVQEDATYFVHSIFW